MTKYHFKTLIVSLALVACGPPLGKNISDGGEHEPRAVAIEFQAQVGSQPFSCAQSYAGVGTSNASVRPMDLRFYVHDLRLITATGEDVPVLLDTNDYQYQGTALVDFEDGQGNCSQGDAAVHTVLTGTVPDHPFIGLKLKLGIPQTQNHLALTAQPSPLDKSSLFWGWKMGHIFFSAVTLAEVPDAQGGGSTFIEHFTHLGAVDCVGDPETGVAVSSCDRPNRREYVFESFNPDQQQVVVDLLAVKAGSNVTIPPGCHSSSDDCIAPFENLGLSWSSGQTLTVQSVFRTQ